MISLTNIPFDLELSDTIKHQRSMGNHGGFFIQVTKNSAVPCWRQDDAIWGSPMTYPLVMTNVAMENSRFPIKNGDFP